MNNEVLYAHGKRAREGGATGEDVFHSLVLQQKADPYPPSVSTCLNVTELDFHPE